MFVKYKIFPSLVAKNEFSGSSKLFILLTKTLVSLVYDGVSLAKVDGQQSVKFHSCDS